jgi:cell division protein FtsL
MNAAAKMIHQSSVFQGKLGKMQISKQLYVQSILVILMLLSALAVIYITNITRVTCSQLEYAENEAHQLQVKWGQLLLEQASLVNPGRVEKLAKDNLHMLMPVNKQAYLLRSK